MRYLSILLAALLLMGGVAMADLSDIPESDNVIYIDGHKNAVDNPSMEVRLVRYGKAGYDDVPAALESGDPVRWDVNSSDAVTISACVASNDPAFAGILVTTINTSDNGTVDTSDNNWGYICVRGYCLASVAGGQTSAASLAPGATDAGNTTPYMQEDYANDGTTNLSQDTGILLLQTTTSAGLAPVMLR